MNQLVLLEGGHHDGAKMETLPTNESMVVVYVKERAAKPVEPCDEMPTLEFGTETYWRTERTSEGMPIFTTLQ